MKKTSPWRAAAFALVTLCLDGCPPSGDLGANCRFRGDTTHACGKCLATHCQTRINQECKSTAGIDRLAPLDACGAGEGCSEITGDIAICLEASCASECPKGGDAGATPRFSMVCTQDEDGACRCISKDPSERASGTACTKSTPRGTATGTCCQTSDFPKPGGQCFCARPHCQDHAGSCVCGYFTSSATDELISSCRPYTTCCMHNDRSRCTCSNATECDADSHETPSCAASDVKFDCDDRSATTSCYSG